MALHILTTERLSPHIPEAFSQSVPLSILDAQCARFSPTGAIWIYDQRPQPEEQLVEQLKASFITALNRFPHFAGQLHWAPRHQDGDHTARFGRAMVTFGSDSDPGVEWTIAKLSCRSSDLAPSASSRASGNQVWLGSDFPQNALLASKTALSLGDLKTFEGLPAMLVQVTLLEDNALALAVKMAHPLADASTLMLFMEHWAQASRVQHFGASKLELKTPIFDPQKLDAKASGDIDGSCMEKALVEKTNELPLHRYDWWATSAEGYPPFMLQMTENSKPKEPSLMKDAMRSSGTSPPWKTWDFSQPVSHAVIHFTAGQVNAMRAKISQGTQGPSRLNAVLAHIWSVINRARGLSESEEEVFLNLTMGMRARLDPPLPDGFVGSPLIMAHVVSTGKEVVGKPSEEIAFRIRECVDKFTPGALGAVLHRAAHEVSPQRFWQAFLGRHHILVTSWLRLKENEIDFFGKGILPRYVHPIMPLVDGCLLVVDGCPQQGGLELSLYLEAEAMEQLLRDPLLFP